jgi:tRNA-specific 2-thiouridylase
VTTDLNDHDLWTKEVKLENEHWINQKAAADKQYSARLRYRGPLINTTIKANRLILKDEQRGLAAGQSAVLYDGDRVLGGGIIT